MFCTKCGTKLEDGARFCTNCGTTVEAGTTANGSTVYGEVTIDADVQRMIGVKTEYYLPKFTTMKQLNKKVSWNWCSFLFTTLWFIYRKMYLYALGVWGISVLISQLTNGGGSLLISIAAGIFGNWLYMYHLEQRAKEANLLMPTEKEAFLAKKTGVNKGAVIAILAAEFILAFLAAALFILVFSASDFTTSFYFG